MKNRLAGRLKVQERKRERERAIHVEKRISEERRWLNARILETSKGAERGREVYASLADIKIPAADFRTLSDASIAGNRRGANGND